MHTMIESKIAKSEVVEADCKDRNENKNSILR